jgi:hypothetical protein
VSGRKARTTPVRGRRRHASRAALPGPHLFIADPTSGPDACVACPLPRSNTAVHVDPSELPVAPDRYEVDRETGRP